MSSPNGNATHGKSCRCRRCTSRFLSSTGTAFGPDNVQQGVGPDTPLQPPTLSQAQIAQANRDLQALTNTLRIQRSERMWDDQPCWRVASREGPQPTLYNYPLNMDIDLPSTPSYSQPSNRPTPATAAAATRSNVPHPGARVLPRSNTPVIQPSSRSQRPQLGYSTSGTPRGREYAANAARRTSHTSRPTEQQRQTTPRLSRSSNPSSYVAVNTPESGESSDSDSSEDGK